MHDRRGHNHQAYLWQYSRPGGAVVFDFRLGRGREGPKQFLGNYSGILQTDGYVAYEQVGGPGMVHACCWTHTRRGFCDVVKLNPGDVVATPIVEKIGELFAIDAVAREQGLKVDARQALRREKAPAVLDAIKTAVESARASALPGSTLGKACQYTLGLWPKLIRFLDYAELELSTSLAENSIRPIALGRKNWIHIGSPQAGPKVAAILSIIETCRRIKLTGARISVRRFTRPGQPAITTSIRAHPHRLGRAPPITHNLKSSSMGLACFGLTLTVKRSKPGRVPKTFPQRVPDS